MGSKKTPLEKPPAPDEFEVSIFGPGIGESVVVHLGLGEWMVVDSCRDSYTRKPAALDYLRKLGVDVARSLKLIVVTHWHNDHMLGAAEIFEAAESAALFCSGALRTPEFADLIAASTRDRLGESELPEFKEILNILDRRRVSARKGSSGPSYALEGSVLLRRDASPACGPMIVQALTPSHGAVSLAHCDGTVKMIPCNRDLRKAENR